MEEAVEESDHALRKIVKPKEPPKPGSRQR